MSIHKTASGPWGCADLDALAIFSGAGNDTNTGGRNRYHCSYVVYRDATYIYAENGATGKLDYGGPSSEGGADGTSATQVIQAAIDAMVNGGILFIKSGTYVAQIDLTNKQNIMIQGEGMDYEGLRGTKIHAPSGLNDHVIKIDGTLVYGHRVDIVIKDLTIHGARIYQTSGNLIDIVAAYGVKIINCMLKNAKDYGIKLNCGEQITIESNFLMESPIYFLCGNGCYIKNNEIGAGADRDGIRIESVNSGLNIIEGNTIYMCRKGIFLYGTSKINIVDNLFWQNAWSAIDVNSNCSKIIISGNQILSNDTSEANWAGIDVRNDIGAGCENIIITDNVFHDYQGVPTQTHHIRSQNDSDYLLIENNYFGTYQTGVLSLVGSNNVVCANLGYNPVAASTPAVGASPVTFGPYWYPVYVEVVGNITSVTIRGVATAIPPGAAFQGAWMLYPSDTATIVYPGAAPVVNLWPQ